jgi:acyl-CoA thioester hydrolase
MKVHYSHAIQLRVRYSETDQMGFCYYGNYAHYFEVGRVEAMRKLGISYKELEEKGIFMPVSEFSVTYKSPAYYDDELTVTSKITELKGARLFFEYSIHNQLEKLICTAKTTLVFLDKTSMRPVSAPDFFDTLIHPYTHD